MPERTVNGSTPTFPLFLNATCPLLDVQKRLAKSPKLYLKDRILIA
jgi:hypothetical protein